MKHIITLLLIACSLTAVAQTQENKQFNKWNKTATEVQCIADSTVPRFNFDTSNIYYFKADTSNIYYFKADTTTMLFSSEDTLVRSADRDLRSMILLTIAGFKNVRHDAFILGRFHYAHRITLLIKDLEYQLKTIK